MNKYNNDNRFYHKNVFLRLLQYYENYIRGYSLPVLPIICEITITCTSHVEAVCSLVKKNRKIVLYIVPKGVIYDVNLKIILYS